MSLLLGILKDLAAQDGLLFHSTRSNAETVLAAVASAVVAGAAAAVSPVEVDTRPSRHQLPVLRRALPDAAYEGVFRRRLLAVQQDEGGDAVDDMLFFVRAKEQGGSQRAKLADGEGPVLLRRRTAPQSLPPCGSEAIDWRRTLALNIAAQWEYTLRVAVGRRPSGRLQPIEQVERRVYAAPSRPNKQQKDGKCETSWPDLYFTVEDFSEAFGDMAVGPDQVWVVEMMAEVRGDPARRFRIFQGMMSYETLAGAFRDRATARSSGLFSKPRDSDDVFIGMRGPMGHGAAQAAVSLLPESDVASPRATSGMFSRRQTSVTAEDFSGLARGRLLRVCLVFVSCHWGDVLANLERAVVGSGGDNWVFRWVSDGEREAERKAYEEEREKKRADEPLQSPRGSDRGSELRSAAATFFNGLISRKSRSGESPESMPEQAQSEVSPGVPPQRAPGRFGFAATTGRLLQQAARTGFGLRGDRDSSVGDTPDTPPAAGTPTDAPPPPVHSDPAEWPSTLPPPGSTVEVKALQQASWAPLNGMRGAVVGHHGPETVVVKLPNPHGQIKLSLANCRVLALGDDEPFDRTPSVGAGEGRLV